MKAIFERYLDSDDRVFVPGCGNAPFSPDMYDAGFTNQLCCDTSDVVIKQMKEAHIETRPKMEWEVMDATDTGLDDESFGAIVDKSLIDTLLCCENSVEVVLVSDFVRNI